MTKEFNDWWNEDDLTTDGNNFVDGTPAYWAWEGWCAGVKAERARVTNVLLEMHDKAASLHNYYKHAALEINRK